MADKEHEKDGFHPSETLAAMMMGETDPEAWPNAPTMLVDVRMPKIAQHMIEKMFDACEDELKSQHPNDNITLGYFETLMISELVYMGMTFATIKGMLTAAFGSEYSSDYITAWFGETKRMSMDRMKNKAQGIIDKANSKNESNPEGTK